MSRRLVAALAALALVAKSGGADPSKLAKDSRPVPVDTVLARALATDTMWVGRFEGPNTPSNQVAPDLIPHLRAILQRARRPGSADSVPLMCVVCPDRLPVLISLGAERSSAIQLQLVSWFREAQMRFVAREGSVGMISVRADAPELLALIKHTLPRDSIVQRFEWRPRPDPLMRNGPPSDQTNPKFGEYVYVEELPEATVKVPPEYPAEARKLGVDGTVMVQALVDRDGNVADTRVVKSIPPLDDAAVAAVRQWKFKPAMAKGAPVAVWVAIPIKFTLH